MQLQREFFPRVVLYVYSVDVYKRGKNTCFLILMALFVRAGSLPAQSGPSATPPSYKAGVFPLSEVRRGMHGVAYTVFEGTQPEAMQVEILGVLKNALGPGQNMILARLEGSKPEYTGVVAGMSGSPVYIDGKLLGALSYRIGEFSKEPIAGITPIEEMLDVGKALPPEEHAGIRNSSTAISSLNASAIPGAPPGVSSLTPVAGDSSIHPIESPLVFSGFSEQAVALFGDRFTKLGLKPVAGLGGSAPEGSDQDSAGPVIPGSAISALLVKGDLEISATCTVTYVDPQQLLACGHPITQFGGVSMPMAKAEVLATLPSPLNAFKIVNTGKVIGSFDQDRASAIRGVIGEPATMIPVSIHLHNGSQEHTLHVEVVDNPDITPAAVMVSLYQSLMQTNNYGAELSYSVRGTMRIDGYPTLRLESLAAPTDELGSALLAAVKVGQSFMQVYNNSARLRNVRAIDLDVVTLPGRRSVELETAQVVEPSARPGETVMIEAKLQPFQGPAKNLRIPVRLPQTLSSGPLRILLSDGATLDRLTNSNPGVESPADLSSTIQQLNSEHANDMLYVTLLMPDVQAVIDGRTLSSIPISMANVLEPLRDNRQMSLNGESVVPVTSIPVDAMLSGMRVISLNIQ